MSSVDINRLNRLPESILAQILSFLPARDATRTVLLRTFGDLWTKIDRLDFDDCYFVLDKDYNREQGFGTLKFIRFVRYFLMLHKCSKIRKFRLSFTYIPKPLTSDEISEVEMWIKFAVTRGVEELDLGFWVSNPNAEKFKIPDFVWTSDSLTELRLLDCEVKIPNKVWMGLLKIITLDSVDISNEAFIKLLGCCPLLQDLGITDCIGLTKLNFIAPNIKNVRVCMIYRRWKLMVNCPNVRSFDFSGYVECVELVNLSSVQKVTFCVKLNLENKFKGDLHFKRFLDKVQHAEILILNKVAFSVLTYRIVQNHPCPRNKWKRIVLHTWLSVSFIRALRSLLRYSSCLEELIIHLNDPTDYSLKGVYLVNQPEGDDYMQFDEDDWNFQCLKNSLKKVTMHGLLRSSCNAQVDLARIILKNGLVMDELVIFVGGNAQSQEENGLTREKLFEVSQMLYAFPRASKHTSVYLLNP